MRSFDPFSRFLCIFSIVSERFSFLSLYIGNHLAILRMRWIRSGFVACYLINGCEITVSCDSEKGFILAFM